MITATFKKYGNVITGYKIGGHAFFDTVGKDIVCAATSALTIAISNQIQVDYDKVPELIVPEIINVELDNHMVTFPKEKEEGYVEASHLKENEWNDALLTALLNGLLDIEEQYPDNLKVVVVDGQKEKS